MQMRFLSTKTRNEIVVIRVKLPAPVLPRDSLFVPLFLPFFLALFPPLSPLAGRNCRTLAIACRVALLPCYTESASLHVAIIFVRWGSSAPWAFMRQII